MSGTQFGEIKPFFNQSHQGRSIEIVEVLRVNISVTRSEQAHRQRIQIRHQDETKAVRFENGPGFLEKSFRLQQMLENRPKSNCIELCSRKILLQKIPAPDRD